MYFRRACLAHSNEGLIVFVINVITYLKPIIEHGLWTKKTGISSNKVERQQRNKLKQHQSYNLQEHVLLKFSKQGTRKRKKVVFAAFHLYEIVSIGVIMVIGIFMYLADMMQQ